MLEMSSSGTTIDSFGDWHCLSEQKEGAAGGASAMPAWTAIDQLGEVNGVLQRLSMNGVRHDAVVIADVQEALRIGKEVGLSNEDERICFAAHRVDFGVPIENAKRLAQILDAARQDGGSYRNLIDDFDRDDWDVVVKEASIGRIHEHKERQ